MRRFVSLTFVVVLLLNGCDAKQGFKIMKAPVADWKALEFTCIHEDAQLPKLDAETEEWYQQANASYKAGIKTDNQELLLRSFELMSKAAQRGHVKAMNNVVVSHLKGEGVKQSDAKAVEWAEALIKLESGKGYYHMGVFLEQGIGVKQDRAASLAYFRKAADLGNAQGQLVAGDKILAAVAQTPEREQGNAVGTKMLSCALEQGLAEAGHKLGYHYSTTNTARALESFQAAGRLGHNQSLYVLYSIFKDGEYGIQIDDARAACYKRLSDESDSDKTRKFPDIDKICPLPPKPMKRG